MVELVLNMPIRPHLRKVEFDEAIVAYCFVGAAIGFYLADFVAISQEELVGAALLPRLLNHTVRIFKKIDSK
jgi:hypothetical protein